MPEYQLAKSSDAHRKRFLSNLGEARARLWLCVLACVSGQALASSGGEILMNETAVSSHGVMVVTSGSWSKENRLWEITQKRCFQTISEAA
jgi:hypothetical protein